MASLTCTFIYNVCNTLIEKLHKRGLPEAFSSSEVDQASSSRIYNPDSSLDICTIIQGLFGLARSFQYFVLYRVYLMKGIEIV